LIVVDEFSAQLTRSIPRKGAINKGRIFMSQNSALSLIFEPKTWPTITGMSSVFLERLPQQFLPSWNKKAATMRPPLRTFSSLRERQPFLIVDAQL
jgi:hypothetical protein